MIKLIGFSDMEFTILCDAHKIGSIPCFSGKKESFDQEEYNLALFNLFQRGLLLPLEEDDAGFSLSDEIKDIFTTLTQSEFAFHIVSIGETSYESIVYLSREGMLISTPGERNGEYIKIAPLEMSELIDLLESLIEIEEAPEEYLSKIDDSEEIAIKEENVLYKIEKSNMNSDQIGSLIILKEPLMDVIVFENSDETNYYPYTFNKIRECIRELLEVENDIS